MNMKRVEMESKSDRIASFVKKAMAAVATSIEMVALMGVPVLDPPWQTKAASYGFGLCA